MTKWVYVAVFMAFMAVLYAVSGWYIPADMAPILAVSESGSKHRVFAGSESCRDCHERFYELWSTSHHGQAMQPFTPEFARNNLTPHTSPLTIEQNQYQTHLNADGGYITESGPDGRRNYPIVHVMGGKYIYYFLTPMERGRLQVMPLAYDVGTKEWYDTAGSMIRHFGGEMQDEALDWKDPMFTFNNACYHCHVSQLDKNYDLSTDTYQTTWAEPGINCETCHGPAQAHNDAFRAASPDDPPESMRLVTVTQDRGFTAHQVDSACTPCHAKMAPLTTSFVPGEEYFNHYDLVTLEDPDFYPDGRDLGENFTYTLWRMNPCSKAGQMDCMHCHTSSGRYRFPTTGDRANESCLSCHEERVKNATTHTHHKAGSPGNRCIACHMPMTEFARMRRSDHSIRPPMPSATKAFGSPNACNLCHEDKDAEWADRMVRQWRGRDYQKPILEAGRLIEAARKGDWSKLGEMAEWIKNNPDQEIYVNSLVRLMRNTADGRKWPLLIALVQHNPSPLVRASAVETLGDYLTHETAAVLQKAAEDPYRLVRIRAAFALASVPESYFSPDQQKAVRKAKDEFLESVGALPDNWTSHFNLGVFQMNSGQYYKAAEAFMTAHRLRADALPPLINAAMAWNMAGDNEHAERSLRKAAQQHPDEEAVHLNLALLLAEQKRFTEAENAFRQALRINDKSATAAYNLAVILSEKSISEAVFWARKAYQNAPDQHRYGYAYAAYLNQLNRTNEAAAVLEKLVDQNTDYAAIYHLLGHIYPSLGRTEEAIALFNKALNNPAISSEEKAAFVQQIQVLSSYGR